MTAGAAAAAAATGAAAAGAAVTGGGAAAARDASAAILGETRSTVPWQNLSTKAAAAARADSEASG